MSTVNANTRLNINKNKVVIEYKSRMLEVHDILISYVQNIDLLKN